MQGLMLLANGFEDTEALTTRDILSRAGIKVVTSSIDDKTNVISSFGLNVKTDISLKKIKENEYDFLILPGGGVGTKNLKESEEVSKLVLSFYNKYKLIGAICAAPSVLGRLGLLKDKRYTCYAGCNEGEGILTNHEMDVFGNIITARSMLYTIPFALAIVEKLVGKEIANKVYQGIEGLTCK